jgi:hypothetical protein
MVNIINELEKLGFLIQKDGTYLSISLKTDNEVLIKFVDHHLECYESTKLLFSVLYMDLSTDLLFSLLSEFGVIEKTIKK